MNEGDKILTSELVQKWHDTLKFYDEMIEGGRKLRPLRFLVRYIIECEYSIDLYPGTSHFNLSISIPTNQRIDYRKTLNIDYDQLSQKVNLKYWDCKRGERTKENLNWSTQCEATEINDAFEFFLTENRDWKKIKERHANKT